MRKIILISLSALFLSIFTNISCQFQEKESESSYENVKIKKFNISVQCWTFREFSFFEALEKIKDLGIKYVEAYPGQRLSLDLPDTVKFSHTMEEKYIKLIQDKLADLDLILVSYGVVRFDNDPQSMKQLFDFAERMGIENIVTEPEFDDYTLIDKMVRDFDLNVAIHNHPKPSKYWNPETVLRNVEGFDKRIGSCSDTGHWLRSGINPIDGLRLLKGRIINLHLKDLNKFGDKKAHDVPFGEGIANIHDILAELTLQGFNGYISIEYEYDKESLNPSPSIIKGLEYIDSITYYKDYQQLLSLHRGRYNKHGWNQYGPGYFVLDEKTGILKSEGGMGLFWYSKRKFKDFILELDFMCEGSITNSGVFLRVPDIPISDDYIYHAFEIQIDNTKKGIHRTGAVYDAEPPQKDAFKNPGEWNHYKINFQDNNIKVELNDELIVNWDVEPRGKIKDFAEEGYIGLQNHDSLSSVFFRDIYVKELK